MRTLIFGAVIVWELFVYVYIVLEFGWLLWDPSRSSFLPCFAFAIFWSTNCTPSEFWSWLRRLRNWCTVALRRRLPNTRCCSFEWSRTCRTLIPVLLRILLAWWYRATGSHWFNFDRYTSSDTPIDFDRLWRIFRLFFKTIVILIDFELVSTLSGLRHLWNILHFLIGLWVLLAFDDIVIIICWAKDLGKHL